MSFLSACSTSEPKPEIIVVDKSINRHTTDQRVINQETDSGKTFVLSPKTKAVKQQAAKKTPKITPKTAKTTAKKPPIKIQKPTKTIAKKPPIKIQKPVAPVKQQTPAHWSFPVTGKITQHFSPQHAGITFDTTLGQAVRATDAGIVIYSDDKIKKHGKMVIIKHPLGFYSAYTQNHTLRVKKGDKVAQRDIIALTGKSDFYFEMKKFKTPIDPLKYLK